MKIGSLIDLKLVAIYLSIQTNKSKIPKLTFPPHINRLSRDCYYQLRVISRSLISTATAPLVHAFITARLDYCSTLYVGLPAVRLGCLKRAIRIIARLDHRMHS